MYTDSICIDSVWKFVESAVFINSSRQCNGVGMRVPGEEIPGSMKSCNHSRACFRNCFFPHILIPCPPRGRVEAREELTIEFEIAAQSFWNRENQVPLGVGEQYITHQVFGKDE